ncbi:Com family DNA-binding transcriptional regulator [Jeongeupia chitinilytica]|uniref:Com family DNA-binding transcriptional regulator n=1 Tax=Jeongeupia chitinilytica TaxID=1041641 RepID=UPI00167253D1|nr:Com family DNA-binding transcriptional regulator [Jeongeupia chitinilytica]
MKSNAHEIRCGHCGRKLAEGQYTLLTIKCPRCRALNHLKAESLTPVRQRAPTPGANHGRESDHSLAGRQTSPG